MNKLEAIIFDFDGTLADVSLDFELMKTRIAALGEVFLDERPTPGATPALEWLEELVEQAMLRDRDEAMEFRTRGGLVITAMELDAARDGRLFDFTRPALETLNRRGVASGIITRNISAAVRTLFPEVESMVRAFIPREIAVRVKPAPEHLFQALDVLGVQASGSLMVGDHPMDVLTAKNAGALSAAVTSGSVDAEVFSAMSPDFIASDVEDLMDQLIQKGLV